MANKHATLKELFDAIANAIRAKTNSNEEIIADNFPEAIEGIDMGADVSNVTAAVSDVRKDKIFVDSNGAEVTGSLETRTADDVTFNNGTFNMKAGIYDTGKTINLAKKESQTYTPGTTNQVITIGHYLTGEQTILGDSALVSENIKSGVSIFGVPGGYVGESSEPTVEWLSSGDIGSSANSVVIEVSDTIKTLYGFALVYEVEYEGVRCLYTITGDGTSAECMLVAGENSETLSKTPQIDDASITIRDSGLLYYYASNFFSGFVIYEPQ